MGRAKEIVVKVIPSNIANEFIIKHHYSKKKVNNSKLHFGVFLDNQLHGVMSYGSSLQKSRMVGLVEGTKWNEFLELNRMAFDDVLPRNSESRAISQSIKLIKKNAPHIKWIISFADGCQCGDGTIYRASNFILTDIKKNEALFKLPNGEIKHQVSIQSQPKKPLKELNGKCLYDISGGTYSIKKWQEISKAELLKGYQLRYIYFIDKSYRKKLTVPEIPFSKINEIGAGMYKGKKKEDKK